MAGIPKRSFGKTNDQISALGLGGHHLGDSEDQTIATRIVHEATDGGITFFDNCWEYNLARLRGFEAYVNRKWFKINASA